MSVANQNRTIFVGNGEIKQSDIFLTTISLMEKYWKGRGIHF